MPCHGPWVTDASQGTVSWSRGGKDRTLAFDEGCQADAAKKIFAQISEAARLVAKWGAKGAVIRSERLRSEPTRN